MSYENLSIFSNDDTRVYYDRFVTKRTSSLKISEKAKLPTLLECPWCCLRAEKLASQSIVGNTHDTRVKRVASSILCVPTCSIF